jgi:hypothetical protein
MILNQDLIRTRCQEIEDSPARLEKIKIIPKKNFQKTETSKISLVIDYW